MTSTVFTTGTVIESPWLNDVNDSVYNVALPNTFTGNGITVAFTLAAAPISNNSIVVFINGVYQQKSTYTVVGTTLTFSTAPPITSNIEVIFT